MQVKVTDQVGRTVEIAAVPPLRIVSLVPSQTELLHALGLDEEVVGITKFCIHPPTWHKTKTRVGGTKNFKVEQVLALQPDLVIANKEENEKGSLALLEKFVPVWISDVRSIDAALVMIKEVGRITGKIERASRLALKIGQSFDALPKWLQGKRVAYGIWYDPWMFASSDTFIGDVLKRLGAVNVAEEKGSRYPSMSTQDLISLAPDYVLLSSEPFPFKMKHANTMHSAGLLCDVQLVDGSYFSWYGSRLMDSVPYLNSIFEVK